MLFTGPAIVVPAVVHEIYSAVDGGPDQAGAFSFARPPYVVAAQSDCRNFFPGTAEILIGNAVPLFDRPKFGADGTHCGDGGSYFQKSSTRNAGIRIKRCAEGHDWLLYGICGPGLRGHENNCRSPSVRSLVLKLCRLNCAVSSTSTRSHSRGCVQKPLTLRLL